MIEFEESNMKFCFPDEDLYHIEKSPLVRKLECVAVCECVAKLKGKVCFIEAKSSAPRFDNTKDFDVFIREIVKKFADSLSIYHAALARHDEEPIPQGLRSENVGEADYQLCLIVHGHSEEWLPPIHDELKSRLNKHVLEIWRLKDVAVKVVNEVGAKRNGWIFGYKEINKS